MSSLEAPPVDAYSLAFDPLAGVEAKCREEVDTPETRKRLAYGYVVSEFHSAIVKTLPSAFGFGFAAGLTVGSDYFGLPAGVMTGVATGIAAVNSAIVAELTMMPSHIIYHQWFQLDKDLAAMINECIVQTLRRGPAGGK